VRELNEARWKAALGVTAAMEEHRDAFGSVVAANGVRFVNEQVQFIYDALEAQAERCAEARLGAIQKWLPLTASEYAIHTAILNA